MSENKKKVHYGGQAVIEGVMMRGRDNFAVACRKKSDGEIVSSREAIMPTLKKLKWLRKPFLRGVLMLIDSMALGMRALMYSAEIAAEDEEPAATNADERVAPEPEAYAKDNRKKQVINGIAIGAAMVVALGLAVGIFWFVPTAVAWLLKPWAQTLPGISIDVSWLKIESFRTFVIAAPLERRVVLGLIEGAVKLSMLLGYVSAISLWSEIRRVFQYHGAEHKTINAYEAGEPLEVDNVRKYSTVHVRCGTSFLLVVIITSIIVYAFIPWHTILQRFLYRLLLLPLVAGIAYEVIQFAGRRKDSRLLRAFLAPGLLMQKITTKEPTDDQVEVAIKSLQLVLESESAPAEPTPSPSTP
ncbi:MAG: DUF1385 domain-containing protein [Armatimonadota bacterium]|nr:DUF1385 domain-containing protein [Armatimonadota bacterium]